MLRTNDFLHDKTVSIDKANAGDYLLGNQPDTDGGTDNLPYIIEYFSETQYFSIALLKEPLGAVRISLEHYLMNTLGLSQSDMCKLKYDLSVPDSVNTHFAGRSLGFSFCPDAEKLP